MNGELCVQFLILGEPSTKCFIRVIREEFCSLWNAQFEIRERKKKKEEQGDFHILQQEQKEELTKGIPFIYKASDLMMSQALDIGYDKALK